ncbi:pentatricopeptide repeat-containing protein At1g09900-like [Nymphaea colorata]|uniref:pentatricopeptide repeat-containing protein At1g09900-like n=1 Tax=Nymphaea colorata TaxID=210225 RepID=UPI00129D6CA0|nr:pentatricopeptide repeat-containing protein At1g09900-like [Nymphaea colorata]
MRTLIWKCQHWDSVWMSKHLVFLVKNPLTKDSVARVVEIVNSASGGCCKSGIHSLISYLSRASLFDLAVLVMEKTAKRTSYYNLLIGAKCRNGSFEDARHLLDEMKGMGCDPNVKSYNFLLGSLCKSGKIAEACELIEIMEHSGYQPDEITYEIIAYHACRIGRMDFATEFLDRMLLEGLSPRFTTYAAFVKGYFYSGQVHGAHRFVAEMCYKDKSSANMNYSLLASLFQKSGKFVDGYSILVEMMEKGLKPNFPVFVKLVKNLHHSGRRDMAKDLKVRFSKFAGVVCKTSGG